MITLKNITLRRSAKVLLDHANATLNPGEKIGLIGRNGAGKSSLFALLSGRLHEDSGDFSIPAQWRMAQVAQDMPETDQSATDFVIEGDQTLMQARAQVQAAHDSDDGEQLGLAYMQLYDAGENDASARAQALILGLGFQPSELMQPVNSFSGGWRMRLQLARALMCPSDLLLLDEPTNHLDLDALVWLESWLQRYSGTMLVISHDREFLDAITQVTLHIDQGKLTRYGGNYSKFEELRAEQMELQQAAYAKQQDKIAHLQKFIDRFKAQATKAKQAQSRVKALDRMQKIAPLMSEADFTFEFAPPANLPNPMLSLQQVEVGYQQPQVVSIVKDINRSVLAGQRIGILGANGQGKSTLVKTIAGDLPILSGQLVQGRGLNIGYFAQQELDVLHAKDSPLQHMISLAKRLAEQSQLQGQGTREQDLRNFLGQFNFGGDMVNQAVGSMSGGEKARLVLCMLVWQRPNLLLLDEPTNHLDLTTREALSMALNEFEGTVMLVSHDRALLRAVCDEFWLVSRGGVAPFDGDLEDYQRYLLDEAKRLREQAAALQAQARAQASESASAAPPPASSPEINDPVDASPASPATTKEQRQLAATQRKALLDQKRPLKKELDQVDTRLTSLQKEQTQLHEQLSTQGDASAIAQAGKRLNEVDEALETLEMRWLELSQALEQIEAQLV